MATRALRHGANGGGDVHAGQPAWLDGPVERDSIMAEQRLPERAVAEEIQVLLRLDLVRRYAA
jgi:hypothetical protein